MITPSYGLTATERVLPRLALDWTTGLAQPGVDVVRAGVATFVGSNGFIQSATADTQRVDWSTGTAGLLVEETRTNSIKYSESFNALGWVTNNTTLQSSSQISPDGVSTAQKLTATANAGNILQSQSITSGVTYTHAIYVMSATGSNVAGKIVAVTTDGSATPFTAIPNVWTRVSNSSSWGATANRFPRIIIDSNGDALYIWGSQFEVGAFPTSYIPTEATAVTRNADVATMTGTNFSDWYNQSEGAIYCEADSAAPITSTINIWQIYQTADTTNRQYQLMNSASGLAYFIPNYVMRPSGSVTAQLAGTRTDIAQNTFTKICVAYKLDSFAASQNAGTVQTDSSGAVTANMDILAFGPSTPNAIILNGHIKKFMYWPQRLINAEVQSFSK